MNVVAAIVLCVAAVAASTAELGAEFRVLRQQPGHFSGGAWSDDVDRWGGRKHQVMTALAEALGDGKHTRAEVVAVMGEPDHVLTPRDPMFGQAYDGDDRRVRELVVYEWRGMHDFLFYTSDGQNVFGADWWMALE